MIRAAVVSWLLALDGGTPPDAAVRAAPALSDEDLEVVKNLQLLEELESSSELELMEELSFDR
jgi:hypothetical protein